MDGRGRVLVLIAQIGAVLAAGCGAKTGLDEADAIELPDIPVEPECLRDEDCDDLDFCNGAERCILPQGRCQDGTPPDCDDFDPCSVDRCDSVAGRCVSTVTAIDEDADGYAAGPCGPDCVDTDPLIHPGAPERCNAIDDDCDLLADEGLTLEPEGIDVRVTVDLYPNDAGGLAWSGEHWSATYWDYGPRTTGADVHYQNLDVAGMRLGGVQEIARFPGDAYGAQLVYTPEFHELAGIWEDRRDGNFEIYFVRLDTDGVKLQPDLRLSFAPDFSLYADLVWTGVDYGIVWEDFRHSELGPDNSGIYFARVDGDGLVAQAETRLTFDPSGSESPEVAFSGSEYGVAYLSDRDGNREIYFMTLDLRGNLLGETRVSRTAGNSVRPVLTWGEGEFAMVWQDSTDGNEEVYLARVRPDLTVAPESQRLTYNPSNSRYPDILWTGLRYLVVWTDFRDGNYELYFTTIGADGLRETGDRRITNASGDSIAPVIAKAANGDVGILFDDMRDSNWEVYFTRLLCGDVTARP